MFPSAPASAHRVLASIAMIFFVLFALFAREARAETKLDGRWKQSPLREDFTVQQWLDARCGPAPQSTSTGGGELVEVRMEGDELTFVGGGRVFRTNGCYDPMPTLARDAHSRTGDGKTWRTRCATAPTDPRKAVLNTLVVATTDTQIDLVETGRYEITLENGRCMADVKRTRKYTRVTEEPSNPAASVAPPAPVPTEKTPERPVGCTSPGEPAKLEVRPSKKLLRTGESFVFRGLVLDAAGCDTHGATSWRLASEGAGKGLLIDGAGKVTVAKDATEGTFEIVATAAGRDARVIVEIVAPAHYDELLARSGLNAAGENDEASSVAIASTSIGAGEGKVEDRSRERRFVFLAIIGGVLLVLAIVGIALSRRSRRAKSLLAEADERHENRLREVLDRRRHREEEHARQMRAHHESVAAARDAVASVPPPSAALVCPVCGRSQEAGVSFCPHDGTKLVAGKAAVPLAAMTAPLSAGPPRGKICPTCGSRFEGAAEFCGKDGTILVLLN